MIADDAAKRLDRGESDVRGQVWGACILRAPVITRALHSDWLRGALVM